MCLSLCFGVMYVHAWFSALTPGFFIKKCESYTVLVSYNMYSIYDILLYNVIVLLVLLGLFFWVSERSKGKGPRVGVKLQITKHTPTPSRPLFLFFFFAIQSAVAINNISGTPPNLKSLVQNSKEIFKILRGVLCLFKFQRPNIAMVVTQNIVFHHNWYFARVRNLSKIFLQK